MSESEKRMDRKLLTVKNLKASYFTDAGPLQVIRGFDLELERGEIAGVLGESGSGKTVSSRMIARLMEPGEGTIDSGEIIFNGRNLLGAESSEMRRLRGREIACIFQDPSLALNPYRRIGRQLRDVLRVNGLPDARNIVLEALREVGIDEAAAVCDMYPFQLSGGQNQRVMICQAVLCRPQLLIADEPTSSIDASLRKRILDLLARISRTYRMAVLIITHDFDVARYLCDRLVIMYGGLVVEQGRLEAILSSPLHPYTAELIACSRSLDEHEDDIYTLEGTPLTPHEFSSQCPFFPRCRFAAADCAAAIPEMTDFGERSVRCFRPLGRADEDG